MGGIQRAELAGLLRDKRGYPSGGGLGVRGLKIAWLGKEEYQKHSSWAW